MEESDLGYARHQSQLLMDLKGAAEILDGDEIR